jgi:hypothetical protein
MVVCRQAGDLAVATFGASVRFGARFGSVFGSRSVRFVCGSVGWRAGLVCLLAVLFEIVGLSVGYGSLAVLVRFISNCTAAVSTVLEGGDLFPVGCLCCGVLVAVVVVVVVVCCDDQHYLLPSTAITSL